MSTFEQDKAQHLPARHAPLAQAARGGQEGCAVDQASPFAAFDWLDTPIYVLDDMLRCVFANQAVHDFLGVPATALLNRSVYPLFPAEQAKALEAADRKAMAGPLQDDARSSQSQEQLTLQGQTRRVNFFRQCRLLRETTRQDGRNHNKRYLVVRLENAGDKEAWLQEIHCLQRSMSCCREFICIVDQEQRILYANDVFCKAHGLDRRQVEGCALAEVMGSALYASTLRPHVQRCLASETVDAQAWIHFGDLGARRMDIHCLPWFASFSGQRRAIITCRDTTRMAGGLCSQPSPLKNFINFFEHMRDTWFLLDLEGNIKAANSAALTLLGQDFGKLQGKNFGSSLCDSGARFSELVKQLETQHSVQGARLDIEGHGRRLSCLCSLRYLRDQRGSAIGIEAALQLLSDLGGKELEPNEYRILLERRVLERTSEVTRTNKLLLDKVFELEAIKRELSEYRTRLRELAFELSLVEQRERRRLSLQLHDGVGQDLAMARIQLSSLRKILTPLGLEDHCDILLELIKKMIDQSRCLIWEMSSPELYELGFEAAIEELAEEFQERHQLRVSCIKRLSHPLDLSQDQQIMLFQMVRELLTNVVKHAEAETVSLEIDRDSEDLLCRVTDDGKGFPPKKTSASRRNQDSGFGLFSIRERLDLISGSLQIQNNEKGACCLLRLPLRPPDPGRKHMKTGESVEPATLAEVLRNSLHNRENQP